MVDYELVYQYCRDSGNKKPGKKDCLTGAFEFGDATCYFNCYFDKKGQSEDLVVLIDEVWEKYGRGYDSVEDLIEAFVAENGWVDIRRSDDMVCLGLDLVKFPLDNKVSQGLSNISLVVYVLAKFLKVNVPGVLSDSEIDALVKKVYVGKRNQGLIVVGIGIFVALFVQPIAFVGAIFAVLGAVLAAKYIKLAADAKKISKKK